MSTVQEVTVTTTTQSEQREQQQWRGEARGRVRFCEYGITAEGWGYTEPTSLRVAILLAAAAPGGQVMRRWGWFGGRRGWGCRYDDWQPYVPTPAAGTGIPWWR